MTAALRLVIIALALLLTTRPEAQATPPTGGSVLEMLLASGGESNPARQAARSLPLRDRITLAMQLGDRADRGGLVAPHLIWLLSDPDRRVRSQAAASLARLGDGAFPAMLGTLDGDDLPLASNDLVGSGWRPATASDYVAWSFINSRSSPHAEIVRWTRARLEAVGPDPNGIDPLAYFLEVLGRRDSASTPALVALLADPRPELRRLALNTLERQGPFATPAIVPLAEYISRTPGPEALLAIRTLAAIGPAAQPDLASLLARHPSAEIRAAVPGHLDSSPDATSALLHAALGDSSEAVRSAAAEALMRRPALPAAAIPLLIPKMASATTRQDAMMALTRAEPGSTDVLQALPAVRAALDAVLRPQQEPSYGSGGTETVIALMRLGPQGVEVVRSRLRNPALNARLCDLVRSAVVHLADASETTSQDESMARLTNLSDADCAVRPQIVAIRPPPGDPAEGPVDAAAPAPFPDCDQAGFGQDPELRADTAAFAWGALGAVAVNCPALFAHPDFANAVTARIERDFGGFDSWAAENLQMAEVLLDALWTAASTSDREAARLAMRLSTSAEPRMREWSMNALGESGSGAAAVINALDRGMGDFDPAVSRAASVALVGLGPGETLWDSAAAMALSFGLEEDIHNFLHYTVDRLRPQHGVGAWVPRVTPLPSFPWPPPRYASRITFGRELDRALLGRPADRLRTVHDRLVRALSRLDPGFESGLFTAPGGFVLLTRVEQISEDGRPLRGPNRWRDVRPPPRSLTDYLVRLFLAPPGYYRTIAFVFTNRSNFGIGSGSLPAFSAGGSVLPDDVESIPFSTRHAYVLVYAFVRRDAGAARPYTLLSATIHLQQSGLVRALQSQ